MKKKLLFLFITLLVFLCTTALSEVSGPVNLSIRNYSIHPLTDTFACQMDGENYYRLVDGKGNVIVSESAQYTNMNRDYNGHFFRVEVKNDDGVHNDGLIDAKGKVIIPAQYADIKVIDDRWQAGIKLTPSSAEDKDYTFSNWSTGEKTFYRIDTVDIYFDGALAGTLNRNQYGDGSYTAYGAYLQIRDIEKKFRFYDKELHLSPYESTLSGEFDSVYKNRKNIYYHQGTGQVAFDASCTLNPEDLANPYLYNNGVMYDLQGNVMFQARQNYDYVQKYVGDFAVAKMNRKCGLVDKAGNEVIPVEYDNLGYSETRLLESGYISAVKDEKFGFLDANGNVTCDFVYTENIVRNYTPFATIKNLDGTIIVLSAAVGELPEHYTEVYFPSSNNPRGFIGENAAGQRCVVDLYGETIIPYSDEYSNITINNDLSVIICERTYRDYDLYSCSVGTDSESLSKGVDIQAPSSGEVFVSAEPAPDVTLPPVQIETYWTCENGHELNTGKFCSECGLPKPEPTPTPELADGTWTCENGHTGNTGKFCSECGAPRPVVVEGPWTCENGHTGNTGKFCSECGLPKPGAE
jgi:hypothetical protein